MTIPPFCYDMTGRHLPSPHCSTKAGFQGDFVHRIHRSPFTSFIVAALFTVFGIHQAAAQTTVTDIGTINGRGSIGVAINHAGDVAGISEFSGTIGSPNGPGSDPFLTHAVLFHGGALQDLGAVEGNPTCPSLGCQSEAFGLNDQDWVVGWTDNGSSGTLAYVWLPTDVPGGVAGFNVLPALAPDEGSAAVSINASGQIVGFSKQGSYVPRAILWQLTATGPTMADLGTLRADGGGGAVADQVNEHGEIVGSAQDENFGTQGFLYLPAPAHGLPAGMNNLTAGANVFTAEATCLNGQGQVAGVLRGSQPFLWLPSAAYGLPAGLSQLKLDRNVLAFFPAGISDRGLIVGRAFIQTNPHTGEYVGKAAAWRNGKWIYLDDLLPGTGSWDLLAAQAVTHAGKTTRITGVGLPSGLTDINGLPAVHGFVLNVTCTGDLDGDGDVDQADLAILRSEIGQTVTPGTDGDLNGDGVVNQQDFNLLVQQTGSECLSGSGVVASLATSTNSTPVVAADGPALPTFSGAERYGATSFLRRFEPAAVTAALASGTPATGTAGAGAATTSKDAIKISASRPLSAWPLPYRGGMLIVSLAADANVGPDPDVAIFDLAGRRVSSLSGAAPTAPQTFRWDGRDAGGTALGNGVYFLRATGAGHTVQLKIAVAR